MVTSGSESCVIFLHPIQQEKVTEGFELRLILFDSWVQLCQFQGALNDNSNGLNVMNMTLSDLSYVRNFLFWYSATHICFCAKPSLQIGQVLKNDTCKAL